MKYSAAEYLEEELQVKDYDTQQAYAFTHDVDASCFRLKYQGHMLVAIISERESDLAQFPALRGMPYELDKTTLNYLSLRKTAANKLGPWAEGHYRA